MYLLKRFESGDVLFRQGDASDHVVVIRSGTVDVLREVGAEAIRLGTAGAGEYLGEMGVIEGRSRSATVVAATALEVELIGRKPFLERIRGDPELAHKLLLRMSARLRDVEDMLARLHLAAQGPDSQLEERPAATIAAVTYAAKFYIGIEPIRISGLPFTVGRARGVREAGPDARPDLEIPEPEPFRLSRRHFAVAADDGDLLVRDLGSELGTIVNDVPLGRDFGQDAVALVRGANRVIAGGAGSPFEFDIAVAQ